VGERLRVGEGGRQDVFLRGRGLLEAQQGSLGDCGGCGDSGATAGGVIF
jgi:hypothetical protein